MCTNCWCDLYQFHKFYLRIEKAHKILGLLSGNYNEIENNASIDKDNDNALEETYCDILSESSKNELNENDESNENFQSDLGIDELKFSVKNELRNESLPDNSLLKRKRGRPPKSKSCNDTAINHKSSKAKKLSEMAKQPKKKGGSLLEETETIQNNFEIWNSDSAIKQNTQLVTVKHENESEFNNDTDQGSLQHIPNKLSTNQIGPTKTDHNEKDKFLKDNFKITCYLCNIPFETFFNMRKHFEEQHSERGHVKCCNKKFYRRSILVDHVHFHLNPNYFKCNQCGKVMADRRCLELHAEIHESNPEKNHCCDICGKGFAKLGVLKKHRMIHLSEEEKRFSCSDCGKK